MKMLMIICPENRRDEVQQLVARHDIHAYSESENVIGEGATGKRLGTHAWPQKSILIFTVAVAEKTDELLAALREYHKNLYPGEGLRAFTLPVESEV